MAKTVAINDIKFYDMDTLRAQFFYNYTEKTVIKETNPIFKVVKQ